MTPGGIGLVLANPPEPPTQPQKLPIKSFASRRENSTGSLDYEGPAPIIELQGEKKTMNHRRTDKVLTKFFQQVIRADGKALVHRDQLSNVLREFLEDEGLEIRSEADQEESGWHFELDQSGRPE